MTQMMMYDTKCGKNNNLKLNVEGMFGLKFDAVFIKKVSENFDTAEEFLTGFFEQGKQILTRTVKAIQKLDLTLILNSELNNEKYEGGYHKTKCKIKCQPNLEININDPIKIGDQLRLIEKYIAEKGTLYYTGAHIAPPLKKVEELKGGECDFFSNQEFKLGDIVEINGIKVRITNISAVQTQRFTFEEVNKPKTLVSEEVESAAPAPLAEEPKVEETKVEETVTATPEASTEATPAPEAAPVTEEPKAEEAVAATPEATPVETAASTEATPAPEATPVATEATPAPAPEAAVQE